MEYEPKKWYDIQEKWRPTFHRFENEPVYIFSSVFAPTRINTDIFHQWYYFDTSQNKWITSTRVGFPIIGGTDGGYRGYSLKKNVRPGTWRVEVVNTHNQILGRLTFTIEDVSSPPMLEKNML